MDRKNYSKRREKDIRDAVTDKITALRISILKGEFYGVNQVTQEERFCKAVEYLAEVVTEKYRCSYATIK